MEDNKIQIEDDSSCDRSPASSDSANGSFLKLWDTHNDNGGCSKSSLATLESGVDLEGLYDDKEVAAKAVAFVVNTSRKGVVPLCAQIAKILRVKKKLEQTVEEQKHELVKLRGHHGAPIGSYSGRTSRSTSPTPPSLQSYDDPTHRRQSEGPTPKSSRCSHCSSLSSSPQDSHQSLYQPESTIYTPISQSPTDNTCQPGSTQDDTPQRNDRVPNQHVIRAEVHDMQEDPFKLSKPNETVVSIESSGSLQPSVEKVSKEVQCFTLIEQSEELQRKYQQAAQAKTQLELDLWKAKQEIEKLRQQLKAADELKDERQRVCNMSIVNESPSGNVSKDMSSISVLSSPVAPSILPQLNSGGRTPQNRSKSESPKSRVVILPGCKCMRCSEHQQQKSTHDRGHLIVPSPPGGSGCTTATTHNRITVHIDDHVCVRGDRTGYVRYIGHLDNSNSLQAIYIGVHLDQPVGRNDGAIYGKQYFQCPQNHGVFVGIQDVTTVISRKPSKRPKTGEMIRKHSTDSDSSSSGLRTKANIFRMKRNKAGPHKCLISADARNLIQTSEIQPQPPVSI